MTIHVTSWVIPLSVCLVIWAVAAWRIKTVDHAQGSYSFGGAIVGLWYTAWAIIAGLLVWLIYFIVLYCLK